MTESEIRIRKIQKEISKRLKEQIPTVESVWYYPNGKNMEFRIYLNINDECLISKEKIQNLLPFKGKVEILNAAFSNLGQMIVTISVKKVKKEKTNIEDSNSESL